MSDSSSLATVYFRWIRFVGGFPRESNVKEPLFRQEIARTETIRKRAKSPAVTVSRNRADVVQGVETLAKATFMLNCVCFYLRSV